MKTKSRSKFRRSALLFWVFVTNAWSTGAPNDWDRALPEEVGLDSAALVEMFHFIREREVPVHSVQIVRRGRLVLDAYFYPYAAGMRHDVASVTKSITSTLVGLAIEKGFLPDVREPLLCVVKHPTMTNLDAQKRKLTLEHLLTMQAGWDCGFEPKEARLFEMRRSADWLQFMLDLPMVADPGTRWAYCSGNCHVLSALLTETIGTNALTFGRRELFAPLGIDDVLWPADARGNNHGWGDLQLHPRDMARLGQLFLQRGRWKNRQLISERWVHRATRAHVERTSNRDHYGYFWWVKGKDHPGMFEAVGRGGQRITVWPAKDLVIVFTGGGFEPGDLGTFILKALKSDEPLPKNLRAANQLNDRLAAASRAPSPQPLLESPAMAARISGKTFRLATNSLNLTTMTLEFPRSPEAKAQLTWQEQHVSFPIGLDGVERFSINPLVSLPQAAKGEWLDGETFVLSLDLVGAINYYRIQLTFSDAGRKVKVTLSERTGLNHEQFSGLVASE